MAASSGIEKEQVKEQIENFLKDHPNGTMNKKEFRQFLKQSLPNIDVKKMEGHILRMYDTNQDGLVDVTEFMVIYHIFSGGSAEENLRKIYRIFDCNNDNKITKSEMKRLIKDLNILSSSLSSDSSEATVVDTA